MKRFVYMALLVAVSGFIQAASLPASPVGDHGPVVLIPSAAASVPKAPVLQSKKHLRFFPRISLMHQAMKAIRQGRVQAAGADPADKKATDSLRIGIIALACALIPWYTIFLAIPLGILAISMGSQAKRMGSQKINGKGFGIAALVLVAVWILMVTAFVIGFAAGWGAIFG